MEQLGTAVLNMLRDEVETRAECHTAKKDEMEGNSIPSII
jgi:hypothetical protein